jgi:hypothetical protein
MEKKPPNLVSKHMPYLAILDVLNYVNRGLSIVLHPRIFHLHGDVTNAEEALQNLDAPSARVVFSQEGIVIVPHLLGHRTLVIAVSSHGPPHSVA